MKYRLLLSAACAVVACAVVRAQTPQPAPEFEAATVKKSDPASQRQGLGFQPGGRFNATGVTARLLISAAYGTPQPLPPFLVIGGLDWVDRDRFDVVGKAGGDPAPGPNGPPPIMFQMMQTLLAQRFKLQVHRETRELPVYVLTVNGKPGAALKTSAFDCSELMAASRRGGPPPFAPDGTPRFCGIRVSPGGIQGGSTTMDQFVNSLSRAVSRPVRNQTGLAGSFDFEIHFAADSIQAPPGAQRPDVSAPSDGPSIFTALQEQLGLKLESARGPVDVLVIDSIERPTED